MLIINNLLRLGFQACSSRPLLAAGIFGVIGLIVFCRFAPPDYNPCRRQYRRSDPPPAADSASESGKSQTTSKTTTEESSEEKKEWSDAEWKEWEESWE